METNRQRVFSRTLDGILAFLLVVAVVVWVNEGHAGMRDITTFLQMRVTLLNAAFAASFSFLWMESFLVVDFLVRQSRGLLRKMLLTVAGCLTMTAVVALYLIGRRSPAPLGSIVACFFIISLACQLFRLAAYEAGCMGGLGEPENIIILGTGRRASKAWRELRIRHGRAVHLLGFVDDRDPEQTAPDIANRYIGDVRRLSQYLLENSVQWVIVATPLRSQYDMTQEAIGIAENAGVRVSCMSDWFTLRHGREVLERAEMFVDLVQPDEQRRRADHFKRCIDVTLAVAGLVALAPVFLFIAVAIKLTSRGPVFYWQERYGYHRRKFRIWKFRSMVLNADQLMHALENRNEAGGPIFKIKNDPRITRLGRTLRRLSLDELPQLFNVIAGDMSMVGPRPMSVRDVSRFSDAQLMRRFSVRPGITGLWQVSGRSTLSFDKWIALDFRYIDEWSLGLDMKILARTLPVVVRRTGAV
jgi:exopolysaccharide biosynthesis polyprenyl glycosylphosphotransferase